QPRARHAAPGRDRIDGGERRGGDRGVRRDRDGFDRARRWDRARSHAGRPARTAAPADSGPEGLMRYNPFRNLGLKLLAVVLAALLWITVAGEHIVERSLRVPLEFRNIPEALEIVGNAPDTVDVRLRGSSALLSRVQAGEIVAVLDLGGARAGPRPFHLLSHDGRAPFGVEVAQAVPATLALGLQESARRSVPIVPATDGEPAPGFVIGRVSSEPPMVDIVRPPSPLPPAAAPTT